MKRAAFRLGLGLGTLFAALATASAVLLWQTRKQLQFEAFHQYSVLADELGLRIDTELQRVIAAEEARGYADYRFVVLAGDPAISQALQRSPLAHYPLQSEIPGAIGYFQVAANGEFSTPVYPENLPDAERWGLDVQELAQRSALRDQLLDVLRRNALLKRSGPPEVSAEVTSASPKKNALTYSPADTVKRDKDAAEFAADGMAGLSVTASTRSRQVATPAENAAQALASQEAFDKLNSLAQSKLVRKGDATPVDELRLSKHFQNETSPSQTALAYAQNLKANVPLRAPRKEQAAVLDAARRRDAASKVRIFESELDPFEYSLLGDGHGVLFRKVWRDGQRTIQGIVLDHAAFLDGALVRPFRETVLAQMSDMLVVFRRDVVRVVNAAETLGHASTAPGELRGELLHQLRLSAPFGDIQLLWNIRQLPLGPGGRVIAWTSAALFSLLMLGFVVLYRLGLRQLCLVRQQKDFVSAVSHELNTPLTSIRMYAEILSQGWSGPEKQREYYAYIQGESERLSRLIANVLQLARMERSGHALELKLQRIDTLMDSLRSRLQSQIERAGFTVHYSLDPADAGRELEVDADAFLQIVINLVDNALKFSADGMEKRIDIGVCLRNGCEAAWSVRDYGPGIPSSELRKIFRLFYRVGDEMTRETPGTGIGLALVRELARAMHGNADVVLRQPGSEFMVNLPLAR